jgi:hypothetical protein
LDTLEVGTGRSRIRLDWRRWGQDLHVQISGGVHHIGAVALAGRGPDGRSYEHVLCIPPHKEDQLALRAAGKLHAALGVTVCVSAGVHVDRISPHEIVTVLENVEEGIARLQEILLSG